MAYERRTFLSLGGAYLLTACAPASSREESHKPSAASPRKKAVPAKTNAIRPLKGWTTFKTAFVQSDGRVIDTGNGNISHSEGQGYGMVLAEVAGDRDAFDRIHDWTEKTLLRKDAALFSWRYVPTDAKPVADPNNATDGDILIAWALMRAGARWKERRYLERAAEIRGAIAKHLVRRMDTRTLLLPGIAGFDSADRTTLNLSYYIWPALDMFASAEPTGPWPALIIDGEWLVKTARFGPSALPTDWIDVGKEGRVMPASGRPPRFGFDAIRLPLYLMMGGRGGQADAIARYWKSCADDNRGIPAWVNVVSGEVAPFPLSAGGYAVARRLLGRDSLPGTPTPATDYYGSVLMMIAQL